MLRSIRVILLITAPLALGAVGIEPPQKVSWPAAFSQPAIVAEWVAHDIDAGASRLTVRLPADWKRAASAEKIFSAYDPSMTTRVDIDPPASTSFDLSAPLDDKQIDQYFQSIRTALDPKGYDVIGAGQVRAAGRVWLWHESGMRSLGLYEKIGPFGGGRVWTFTTTPAAQRLTIDCIILFARTLPESDRDAKARTAGATFAAILDRLVFDRK